MGIASQLGTRLADRYYKKLCEENGGQGRPEFRLPVRGVHGAGGIILVRMECRSSIHWIMP